MPLTALLKSAADTCRHCRRRTGVLTRTHRECQEVFSADWSQIVFIAAEAARTHQFDEKTLQIELAEIADRCYGDGATVNAAL